MTELSKLDLTVRALGADVTIVCTDGELYFSKFILGTVDYFKRMLSCGMTESTTGTIFVGYSQAVLTVVLRFIMGCRIPISAADLEAVFDLAEQYGLPGLRGYCQSECVRQVSTVDALSLRRMANTYNLDQVWTAIANDPSHVRRLKAHPSIKTDTSWICGQDIRVLLRVAWSYRLTVAISTQVVEHIDNLLFDAGLQILPTDRRHLCEVLIDRCKSTTSDVDRRLSQLLMIGALSDVNLAYKIDPQLYDEYNYHTAVGVTYVLFPSDPRKVSDAT